VASSYLRPLVGWSVCLWAARRAVEGAHWSALRVSLLAWVLGHALRGSQHGAWRTLLWPTRAPRVEVLGFAAPGYEAVRELLAAQLGRGMQLGAQVVAFVGGRRVVELWAAAPHSYRGAAVPYDGDSLQNIFSSSKALTSLVVAMLADRGALRYEQRISELWPAFGEGEHGEARAQLTVAQLMRHEAGLESLGHAFTFEELSAAGVARNDVGAAVARAEPRWPEDGERRRYHGLTRGWIVNEIVRRVDPRARTVGAFLREEVAGPLGLDGDLLLGVPPDAAERVVPMFVPNPLWALLQSFVPAWAGRTVPFGPGWCLSHLWSEIKKNALLRTAIPFEDPFAAAARLRAATAQPPLEGAPPQEAAAQRLLWAAGAAHPADKASLIDDWNHPLTRGVEIPSANAHANARAMATVASAISCGGAHGGVRLLSERGVARALEGGLLLPDVALEATTKNVNAGWSVFDADATDDRQGFVGWQGYGGSCLQFHPRLQIGFGFAMNLAATDLNCAAFGNSNGLPGGGGYLHRELQMAVLEAAQREQQS